MYGHCRTVVGGALHLVDIPVGLQIREVANARIGAYALGLLAVPEGEGVVVTIGKDDGCARLVERVEVVHAEITAGVTPAAVVIVPRLTGHLHRHQQTQATHDGACHIMLEHPAEPFGHSCHAHAGPDGEGIERAGVGVITLSGLHGSLVQIDYNGQTGHEEEEEDDTELLFSLAAILLVVAEELPYETHQAQYEGQAIEYVVSLIVAKLRGQLALVTQSHIVEEGNTRYPVAVLPLSVALQIVLTTREVPHEVAPVHEVHLVTQEEAQVLEHGWGLHLNHVATVLIRLGGTLHTAHPALISLAVRLTVHTWEEHVLLIHV